MGKDVLGLADPPTPTSPPPWNSLPSLSHPSPSGIYLSEMEGGFFLPTLSHGGLRPVEARPKNIWKLTSRSRRLWCMSLCRRLFKVLQFGCVSHIPTVPWHALAPSLVRFNRKLSALGFNSITYFCSLARTVSKICFCCCSFCVGKSFFLQLILSSAKCFHVSSGYSK